MHKAAEMEAAMARAERASAVLAKLSQKRDVQKRKTKLSKHKHDWQQEQVALAVEANALERDLLGAVQTFAAQHEPRGPPEHDDAAQASSLHRRQRARRRPAAAPAARETCWDARSAEKWREVQVQMDTDISSRRQWREDLFAQVEGMRALLRAERGKMEQRDQLQAMAEILGIIRSSLSHENDSLHASARSALQEALQAKSDVARALRDSAGDQKLASTTGGGENRDRQSPETLAQAVRFRLEHVAAGYEDVPNVRKILDEVEAKLCALAARHAKVTETLKARSDVHKQQVRHNIDAGLVEEPLHGERSEETTKEAAERKSFAAITSLREGLEKLHRETVLRGRGLGLFMERAALQYPSAGRERLERELAWLEERRRLAELSKDASRTLLRELSKLGDDAEKRLDAEMRAHDDALVLRGERETIAARRAEIQARLEVQRRDAAARAAEEARLLAAREEEAREEAERREALEELEREHKRRLVAAFQRQREFEQAMHALQDAQHQETLAEMQRARAPENQRRVLFREQELQRKQQEQDAEAERARAEAASAEQRLAQLKTTVPYFGKLQEIVPSKERLEQHTFSSAVVPDAAYRNYAREGLFQNQGFTDEQVCGDVRFRVVEALRAKGLHTSSYAHTLLRSMAAGTLAQKNLQTSVE